MGYFLKGIALATVLTTAGVISHRRNHLQLQGPVTNCNLGPYTECIQNATHIFYSSQDQQTLMVKDPNGSYEHGYTPAPPPVVPKSTKNPSSTPPQASSSDFPLDLVAGLGTAFTIATIICCAVLRHTTTRPTRNEIQTGVITDTSNVFEQSNSSLGTYAQDLRLFRNNVLPHRQQIENAIPIPSAVPSDNGAMGVLIPQTQQPHQGPVSSLVPQQQTSNSGQGLTLSLSPIPREFSIVEVNLGFTHVPPQQTASVLNPIDAHQASAPSPSPSPQHNDIESRPPAQYRLNSPIAHESQPPR